MKVRLSWVLLMVLVLVGPAVAQQASKAYERGVKAYDQGFYQAALGEFQKALKEAPQEPLYHLWLGMTCYKLGRYPEARVSLDSAARLGAGTDVGASAKRNLAALDKVAGSSRASSSRTSSSSTPSSSSAFTPSTDAAGFKGPTEWLPKGYMQGLKGDDWFVRDTRTCRVFARKGDLTYLEEVVASLDQAYEANARFMGYSARKPLLFYCFSLSDPVHTQPRYRGRVPTRMAGLAVSPDTCMLNLGSWRQASHYEPWEVAEVACHEMNHMFLNQSGTSYGSGDWNWFAEGLAHTVEDRVLPAARRKDLPTMRTAMKGYVSDEKTWRELVADRNDESLEQYRDYQTLLSSIIYFLQGKYGADAIPRLLKASEGRTLDQAFQDVYGKGMRGLQDEWEEFYGIQ